jgi:hypothetical protein
MKAKITRRQLAALVVTAPALAQNNPSVDEVKAAVERRRRDAETLARYPVPMTAEPAFVFRP